jgi:hypothetical protein
MVFVVDARLKYFLGGVDSLCSRVLITSCGYVIMEAQSFDTVLANRSVTDEGPSLVSMQQFISYLFTSNVYQTRGLDQSRDLL